MTTRRHFFTRSAVTLTLAMSAPAGAQQIAGTPGSPADTTTWAFASRKRREAVLRRADRRVNQCANSLFAAGSGLG